jgi:hypothetical protein
MSKVAVFVGLDYHKDSVVICAMDGNGKVFIIGRSHRAFIGFVNQCGGIGIQSGGFPGNRVLRRMAPSSAPWGLRWM